MKLNLLRENIIYLMDVVEVVYVILTRIDKVNISRIVHI